MVKVAGVWERGWITPIKEYDLWAFPLEEFQVDEFIMTPVSGIARDVKEYISLEKAIVSNKKLTPVYVTEKGEFELEDFEHPLDALYIFGKVGFDPSGPGNSVRISTPNGTGGIWPHQAACIVLRHRWLSQ